MFATAEDPDDVVVDSYCSRVYDQSLKRSTDQPQFHVGTERLVMGASVASRAKLQEVVDEQVLRR